MNLTCKINTFPSDASELVAESRARWQNIARTGTLGMYSGENVNNDRYAMSPTIGAVYEQDSSSTPNESAMHKVRVCAVSLTHFISKYTQNTELPHTLKSGKRCQADTVWLTSMVKC